MFWTQLVASRLKKRKPLCCLQKGRNTDLTLSGDRIETARGAGTQGQLAPQQETSDKLLSRSETPFSPRLCGSSQPGQDKILLQHPF